LVGDVAGGRWTGAGWRWSDSASLERGDVVTLRPTRGRAGAHPP
jgi:hypothetical protein